MFLVRTFESKLSRSSNQTYFILINPLDPVDPWSNYIHNGINGKRNGKTEMVASLTQILTISQKYLNTDKEICGISGICVRNSLNRLRRDI